MDSNKPPRKRQSVVLGHQLATAAANEEAMRARHPDLVSPLGITYDFWAGEHDLARFVDSPLDHMIASLVERALSADPDTLEVLRTSLTLEDFYALHTFALRSAVRAIRDSEPTVALMGLAATGLVDIERMDWRDVTSPVGLLLYALERVGGSRVDGLQAVRDLAQPSVVSMLASTTASVDREAGQG